MKITGINLSKEDVVAILSDATYGNDYIEVTTLKSESRLDNCEDFECREDRWAHRLLNGGHIVVYDFNDIDDDGQPIKHRISLLDIIEGCMTKDGMKRVAEYISEDTDMYSGYGLIQCAIFGEEVYG